MRTFGLRRVYAAQNCSLSDHDPEHWKGFTQPLEPFTVEVGINAVPKPGLPLPVRKGSTVVRGVDNRLQMGMHRNLEGTPYEGKLLTEIICWADDVEVSDDLRIHCRRLIDLFAAGMGAAVDRQLLAIEVGEDEWTPMPDGSWRCQVSRPVSLIDAPALSYDEIRDKTLDWVTGRPMDPAVLGGGVLPWLLRAWREVDVVVKFLALFIPIEMVLSGVTGTSSVDGDQIERIKAAVRAAPNADADDLCRLVDVMAEKLRPNLADRFAVRARETSPATADVDIAAFRKFNKMRNELVHRGKDSVRLQAQLASQDVVHLQDLAERYVFASLFREQASDLTR